MRRGFKCFYDGVANLLDGAVNLGSIDIGFFDITPTTKKIVKWASEATEDTEKRKVFSDKLLSGLDDDDHLMAIPFCIVSEEVSVVLGDDARDVSEEFMLSLQKRAWAPLKQYDEDYESYLKGDIRSNEIRYCIIDDNEASFFLNALDAKNGKTYLKMGFYIRRADWSCIDMKAFVRMIIDMVSSFFSEEGIVVETNIL